MKLLIDHLDVLLLEIIFIIKVNLFIRTDSGYDVQGYAVKLADGRKHRFDNFEKVDLIENITISVN